MRASAVLLSLCAGLAAAGLYDGNKDVVVLTDKDFNKKVIQDSGVWLVEAYADWCGHCKAASGAVKEAAKVLKGIVNVGVLDGDANREASGKLGVQGFPTFKLFVDNKASPIDYNGPREAKAIIDFVMKEVNGLVKKRSGGGSTGGSGSGPKAGGSGGGKPGASEPGGGKHVVKGTVANFDDEVLNSQEAVLVEFYAPWCGHCKSLAAPLAEAAAELSGDVKVVAVDATAEASLGNDYGVKGYPTLKFFPPGKKTKASAQDYNGGRSKEDIVSAMRSMVEAAGGAPGTVSQLTSSSGWEEECGGKRICVVAFLPDILDDGASKRNGRLDTLQAAAGKVGRKSTFRFLWSEVGSQPKMEGVLNVGLVPAIYAVSTDKKVFTPYRGPFEAGNIVSFVNGLAIKNEGAQKFPSGAVPPITSAKAWDGKDGVQTAADEFSLEDLDL